MSPSSETYSVPSQCGGDAIDAPPFSEWGTQNNAEREETIEVQGRGRDLVNY